MLQNKHRIPSNEGVEANLPHETRAFDLVLIDGLIPDVLETLVVTWETVQGYSQQKTEAGVPRTCNFG